MSSNKADYEIIDIKGNAFIPEIRNELIKCKNGFYFKCLAGPNYSSYPKLNNNLYTHLEIMTPNINLMIKLLNCLFSVEPFNGFDLIKNYSIDRENKFEYVPTDLVTKLIYANGGIKKGNLPKGIVLTQPQ